MTAPHPYAWLPLSMLAVACSAQVMELDSQRGSRHERATVHVESSSVSAPTDSQTSDCHACRDNPLPETPNTQRRAPETRTTVRVGARQSVTLSIEIAPGPAAPDVDCSPLTLTVVGNRAAVLGETLPLHAYAGELEGVALQYAWSGPEELEITNNDSASFHCDAPGAYDVLLSLVGPAACSTELPFTIDCTEAE